ncbi:hypothetical protein FQP86_13445 [Cobetia crustatorum]|uniref:Uncharacterized protein n=1 Tax=Cobetia crustatorum TaxID=553385 RepID=A0A558HI13_9GAMM|nr:hypothetical protein FQP86_13445 [Cobetia crustatorum]
MSSIVGGVTPRKLLFSSELVDNFGGLNMLRPQRLQALLDVGFRLIDYSLSKQLRSFGLPLLHCCNRCPVV